MQGEKLRNAYSRPVICYRWVYRPSTLIGHPGANSISDGMASGFLPILDGPMTRVWIACDSIAYTFYCAPRNEFKALFWGIYR
jgi:hypothetical protein